jgi:SAM-dependent methyltransferase
MQADIQYHREYFTGHGRTRRIALGVTRCVRRHFDATIDPLDLPPGARVLELGCGLGRFTGLLLDRGYQVTALDLSDFLVSKLAGEFGASKRLTVVAGRAEDADRLVTGPYDAVVGFFFLHHLPQLEPTLNAVRRLLGPGGRLSFCEPNAFNPFVYLQVTFTPGMSWKGEPGIPNMRPGVVFPVLGSLGFTRLETDVYGMLPPVIANRPAGGRLEDAIERLRVFRPLSAYRLFRASLPRS